MLFFENGFCSPSVRQGGDLTTLAFLAEQLIDKGFVNAKDFGDFALRSIAFFYGINDSLT